MMKRMIVILAAVALACGEPGTNDDTEPSRGDAGNGGADARGAVGSSEADTLRSDATPRPSSPDSIVTIHFTRGDSAVAVTRRVHADSAGLEGALRQLLRGPTESERGAGMHSWFSGATAGALRSAAVDAEGRAVIDFADLRAIIPNASSSAGSTMLLRELNATVFEHRAVRSVEYRIEGSCDIFGEWLQYGCVTVLRP